MLSKQRKIPVGFGLRLAMMALTAVLMISLVCPVKAATDYSMALAEALTSNPYSLGDVAAARLAVYGILDEAYKTPQEDTASPLSYSEAMELLQKAFGKEAINSVKEYSITDSDADVSPQGVKEKFISILMQLLGYEAGVENTVQFASETPLQPVGVSDGFSLGDAALYLIEAAQTMAERDNLTVAEVFGVVRDIQQIPFPEKIQITPASINEANAQVKEAVGLVPSQILVSLEQMTNKDALEFYLEYRGYEYQIESRSYTDEIWYLNAIEPRFPMRVFLTEDEKTSSDSVYAKKIDELNQKLNTGSIDDDTYDYEQDILTAEYCGVGTRIDLNPSYNEAWILACDSDEVFYAYQDSALSSVAEDFYKETIAFVDSPTDYEIVMAAKRAVMANASYDTPAGRNDGGIYYSDDAYSLEGFFEDGSIVCTGYSSIFQYLMTRNGIPCVEVLGATRSSKDAAAGKTDHAWNKVKINGSWYNIDICWADTSTSTRYDLKSDEDYQRMRHWGVYNWGGAYVAEENYTGK